MATAPPPERAPVILDIEQDEAVLPVRRNQEESEMDITPMIDITFLLLIFFIVASKLDSDASVPLPEARHGTAVNMQDAIIITMITQSDTAKIYLGDSTDASKLVTGGSPLEQEEEVMEYITETINNDLTKKYIVVKAGGDMHHRDVSRVAKAAGNAAREAQDGTSMYVAVMEKS